jgi:hypothetical protein
LEDEDDSDASYEEVIESTHVRVQKDMEFLNETWANLEEKEPNDNIFCE